MRSWRSAARNVVVRQRPCGALALSLDPRNDQPRNGAMLVLVQVSSMKMSRSGAIRPRYFAHCSRRLATSRRSRSLASKLFFEAQPLGMHEIPHRAIVHLQAALGEFRNEPAKREVLLPEALQPSLVLAPDRFRLVAPNLAGLEAAGIAIAPHPPNHRTHPDIELLGGLPSRQTTLLNRRNNSLAKIK